MNLTCPSCEIQFYVDPEQFGTQTRSVRCGKCGHVWQQSPEETKENAPAEEAAQEEAVQAESTAEDAGSEEPGESTAPADAPAADARDSGDSGGGDGNGAKNETGNETGKSSESDSPAAEDGIQPEDKIEAEMARRRASRRAASDKPEKQGSFATLGWALFFIVIAGLAAGFWFGRAQIVALVPGAEKLYELVSLTTSTPGEGLEIRPGTPVRRTINDESVAVINGVIVNLTGETKQVPLLRAGLINAEGVEITSWTFSAQETTLPPSGETTFETTTKSPPRGSNLSISFVADE